MKRTLAVLAAMLLALSMPGAGMLSTSMAETEGGGISLEVNPRYFAEPEAAVIAFAASLARGDIDGVLNTMADFAIAQKYDMSALVKARQLFGVHYETAYPSGTHVSYLEENALVFRAKNATSLFDLLVSLAMERPNTPGKLIRLEKDGSLVLPNDETISMADFTARLRPQAFSGLKLKQLYRQGGEQYNRITENEGLKAAGAAKGYLDRREYVAIYEYKDKLFLHTYTVGQFPNGWQILELMSTTNKTSSIEGAAPILPEDTLSYFFDPDYTLVYTGL